MTSEPTTPRGHSFHVAFDEAFHEVRTETTSTREDDRHAHRVRNGARDVEPTPAVAGDLRNGRAVWQQPVNVNLE